jgi:hypothetical protein
MSGISGPKRNEIVRRQLALWTKVDRSLGAGVAAGLGVRSAASKGRAKKTVRTMKYVEKGPVKRTKRGSGPGANRRNGRR